MWWIISAVFFVVSYLSIPVKCTESTSDQDYWRGLATSDLEEALKVKWNTGRAKNVILFVGDGMGPNTVTATRIYKHKEEGYLSWEKFPHVGLLKTYTNDKQVPDSAATATALFSGVKVNYKTAGVDASVKMNDCEGTLREESRLKSLVTTAKEAGMATGIVTTMRLTHATPGAMYAYTGHREWECDARMPPGTENCKDIGRQLVEDEPGRNINVIMGGGLQGLVYNSTSSEADPVDNWACKRNDGRNLIDMWIDDKKERDLNYAFVENNEGLEEVDTNETDYLLGVFANSHMHLEHERDTGPLGMPSVVDMTETAIKILQKNENGFFLMVEGGNIDMQHHRGKAKKAINEAATLDEAVKKALEMTDSKDTLIIVTSDHSHSLAINGYGDRGANIFGIAATSKADGKNYTTLTYATGRNSSFQFEVGVDGNGSAVIDRRDPSRDDTTDFNYSSQAGILTDEAVHGGNDVIVYAQGPYSHLFHNIHEQHYVTHVIHYAAGIGDYDKFRPLAFTNTSDRFQLNGTLLILLLSFLMYH